MRVPIIDLLQLLRQASPPTAAVVLTGVTPEFVKNTAALGARGCIVKPIRPAYVGVHEEAVQLAHHDGARHS